MGSFNELMQKYVNTDYDTLVSFAMEAVNRLLPACKKVDPDHNGYYMLTSLILSAIAVDGKLSPLESKMLSEVCNLDNAGIQKMIGMYKSDMVGLANYFADNMGEDAKADAIMLITTFAAIDEKICKEETAFIRRLFE